jgi:hypothetical protein
MSVAVSVGLLTRSNTDDRCIMSYLQAKRGREKYSSVVRTASTPSLLGTRSALCDFVLLDGQWSDRLRRAVTRLSQAGIPTRLAATYSKRNGGVEKFLQALEAWPLDDMR